MCVSGPCSSFPLLHTCFTHCPEVFTENVYKTLFPQMKSCKSCCQVYSGKPVLTRPSLAQPLISCGYQRVSPSHLPPITCCFAPDPNTSRHLLLMQGLFLPGQQGGPHLSYRSPHPSLTPSSIIENPVRSPFPLWPHPQWGKNIFFSNLPSLNPSQYPSLQHQHAFTGNITAK